MTHQQKYKLIKQFEQSHPKPSLPFNPTPSQIQAYKVQLTQYVKEMFEFIDSQN